MIFDFTRYDMYRILTAIGLDVGPYDEGLYYAWERAKGRGMDIYPEPNSRDIFVILYQDDIYKYNRTNGKVRKVDPYRSDKLTIFQNIDELRCDYGYSISRLCQILDISERTYYNWQKQVGEPSGSQIRAIERLFDLPAGSLLMRD